MMSATAFLTGAAGALPSRTVAVLEAIKHAILAGELKPGQALVETDLADVLGVSKTPVREALKTLAGAGLVTMSPYKGATVRVVDDEQARHVYDARLLVEPEALSRAVASGHDWRPAHQALQRAGQAADQAERSLANRDFHRELYAGCGNPLLIRLLDDLRDQTALVSAAAWRREPDHAQNAVLGARSGRAPGRAPGGRRRRRRARGRPAPRPYHVLCRPQFPRTTGEPGHMSLTPAVAETLRQALATVVVVPVTPLQAGGDPDWDAYATLTRRLIDGGITVITPNGNTGEFYALTQAEARQVLETAARASNGRAELLAGVGHDIATAVEAAGHARDHGARMIMIHQPVHPYVSRAGWIDYHAAIANSVPDLGIVLYLRNERITGADIAALADRAPNVVGVKYGVRDASTFAAVARDAGIDRFTWLAGAAELTAPAYWACGAHGFTSGLANVTPALPLAMLDALRGNDFGAAMKVWEKARRFEELRLADASADNVSVVKEALAQLGLCRADVRPPSRPLPADVKDEIRVILAGWGLV